MAHTAPTTARTLARILLLMVAAVALPAGRTAAQCDSLCGRIATIIRARATHFDSLRTGERLSHTGSGAWRGTISLFPSDNCQVWAADKRGAHWRYHCFISFNNSSDATAAYERLVAAVRGAIPSDWQVSQHSSGAENRLDATEHDFYTLTVKTVNLMDADGSAAPEYDVSLFVSTQ